MTQRAIQRAADAIPVDMRPGDGRFGSGPSRIRPEQLARLAGSGLLGTSHRQDPVLRLVREIRDGIGELVAIPDGYEVALGVGGASVLWDAIPLNLVRSAAAFGVFGEFGAKAAEAARCTPSVGAVHVTEASAGEVAVPARQDGVDLYAWPQNETSVGAVAPVRRVEGEALTVIDATSAVVGVEADLRQTDVYYFSPQKNLGADGGLWLAVLSPQAIDRLAEIRGSGRWIPATLDLQAALDASRREQTVNTPAISTLVLLADQLEWIRVHGGREWALARTRGMSDRIYAWAEASPFASPFVANAASRSPVVTTIAFMPEVDAQRLAAVLRAAGIVDVEPYRKLGGNLLRIACFVSIEPDDVERLLATIDFLVAEGLVAREG